MVQIDQEQDERLRSELQFRPLKAILSSVGSSAISEINNAIDVARGKTVPMNDDLITAMNEIANASASLKTHLGKQFSSSNEHKKETYQIGQAHSPNRLKQHLWELCRSYREMFIQALLLTKLTPLQKYVQAAAQISTTIMRLREDVRMAGNMLYEVEWIPRGLAQPGVPRYAIETVIEILTCGSYPRLPYMTELAAIQAPMKLDPTSIFANETLPLALEKQLRENCAFNLLEQWTFRWMRAPVRHELAVLKNDDIHKLSLEIRDGARIQFADDLNKIQVFGLESLLPDLCGSFISKQQERGLLNYVNTSIHIFEAAQQLRTKVLDSYSHELVRFIDVIRRRIAVIQGRPIDVVDVFRYEDDNENDTDPDIEIAALSKIQKQYREQLKILNFVKHYNENQIGLGFTYATLFYNTYQITGRIIFDSVVQQASSVVGLVGHPGGIWKTRLEVLKPAIEGSTILSILAEHVGLQLRPPKKNADSTDLIINTRSDEPNAIKDLLFYIQALDDYLSLKNNSSDEKFEKMNQSDPYIINDRDHQYCYRLTELNFIQNRGYAFVLPSVTPNKSDDSDIDDVNRINVEEDINNNSSTTDHASFNCLVEKVNNRLSMATSSLNLISLINKYQSMKVRRYQICALPLWDHTIDNLITAPICINTDENTFSSITRTNMYASRQTPTRFKNNDEKKKQQQFSTHSVDDIHRTNLNDDNLSNTYTYNCVGFCFDFCFYEGSGDAFVQIHPFSGWLTSLSQDKWRPSSQPYLWDVLCFLIFQTPYYRIMMNHYTVDEDHYNLDKRNIRKNNLEDNNAYISNYGIMRGYQVSLASWTNVAVKLASSFTLYSFKKFLDLIQSPSTFQTAVIPIMKNEKLYELVSDVHHIIQKDPEKTSSLENHFQITSSMSTREIQDLNSNDFIMEGFKNQLLDDNYSQPLRPDANGPEAWHWINRQINLQRDKYETTKLEWEKEAYDSGMKPVLPIILETRFSTDEKYKFAVLFLKISIYLAVDSLTGSISAKLNFTTNADQFVSFDEEDYTPMPPMAVRHWISAIRLSLVEGFLTGLIMMLVGLEEKIAQIAEEMGYSNVNGAARNWIRLETKNCYRQKENIGIDAEEEDTNINDNIQQTKDNKGDYKFKENSDVNKSYNKGGTKDSISNTEKLNRIRNSLFGIDNVHKERTSLAASKFQQRIVEQKLATTAETRNRLLVLRNTLFKWAQQVEGWNENMIETN